MEKILNIILLCLHRLKGTAELKKRYYIDLICALIKKELKVRYRSSWLGYLWSVAQPLSFALVFFVAFKVVMRIQVEDYTLFLISGLFPWQWFSNSVNAAPGFFLGNSSLIKKLNFPRSFVPLTIVVQDMVHFILAIPVIVLFLFVYHRAPSLSWFYGIPLLLAVQFSATFGISLIISSTNLFFRDLERLTAIFTTLLFYFTPIFYPETMIPEEYRPLFLNLNPLTPLMISWRRLFMEGVLDFPYFALGTLYSFLIVVLGFLVYKKLSWKFAEIL